MWEGVGDRRETSIFWPPLLWPATLCLSRSPYTQLEAQGLTQLGDGFVYCILSATSLDPSSSGPQGPKAWCGFPYHNSSITPSPTVTLTSVLAELYNSSRPLNRLLNLWNGMIDRHPIEITVMQFTGHSLPVHQSMSVPWEFFTSSHFISQFPPPRFPLITAIRMCHFLPVHHLGMAFLAGSKAKIQHYVIRIYCFK